MASPPAMSYEPQSGIEASAPPLEEAAPEAAPEVVPKKNPRNELTDIELAELIGPWFTSLRPLAYDTKKGGPVQHHRCQARPHPGDRGQDR